VLTPRESEVVDLIIQGYNNLAIASILEIHEDTVKRHLQNIFPKFNVLSRLDLAVTVLKQRHAAEIAAITQAQ
jgi:DNA-binding NarL/FixJ family response regulator